MDPDDDDTTPERFVNFRSFLAHLMNSGMWLAIPGDALQTMRRAFEKSHEKESTAIQDTWVMAAAQWILWSGQVLLESLLLPYHDDGTISDENDVIEKWHLWRYEFRKVAWSRMQGNCNKGGRYYGGA